jgi:S-adenosylmethionine:tRNA ribosyltransferase-isomerase
MALVMAFYGVEETKAAYRYAVEKRFRLFSYGDLSVWTR